MNRAIAGLAALLLAPPAAVHAADPPGTRPDSIPYAAGRDGYACYRCPTLAVSTQGTVLAFCEGRVNGHKDEDDMDVVLRRSTDGGRTWGPLQVLANDGRNPCKNPCPVVLPSGRILLVWLWNKWIPSEKDRTTREVFVMHSDDDGGTWSKPRSITASVYEREWGWYGTGPCHGIVKRSEPHKGRIVVPARHNAKGSRMFTHVLYSDDGGGTWHIGGSVPRERTSEATAVELSNGDLMFNCRNQRDDENHRVVSISRDGGATFVETWLETQLVEPRGCQASLLFHSMNPRTGKGNILFSNPANGEVRADGTLRLSEDDGRTWTKAFRYAKKPAPNFTGYSDIAVLPDGSVGVLYERGDLDDAGKKAERYDEVAFAVVPFAEILAPLGALHAAEPAASIHETFEAPFDATRFLTPMPNKNTEVRDGVLWTHGSSGGKYPPTVYLPVRGKDLTISFRYRHRGAGGWLWFFVDGDDGHGSPDHMLRVKLLREGVQLEITLDDTRWTKALQRSCFNASKRKLLWMQNGGTEGIELDDTHVTPLSK